MPADARSDRTARLEALGRELLEHCNEPGSQRRIDLLRAFALGADFEVYFDAQGQAVLHTGFFLQHGGEIARIAAPCVERGR
jgi:hypothetical protein